ncbi:MAG: hypothetical protein JXA67_08425 [Micromonosporaceae bacterium]|nr:hypothetical protein [Micromonosporaceae bacterium]
MRAALIYQHATSERDKEIATGMDQRISKEVRKAGSSSDEHGKGQASGVGTPTMTGLRACSHPSADDLIMAG